MNRRLVILLAVVALAGTLVVPAAATGAVHQTAAVNWHAQQAALGREGPVAGASAKLVRDENGISYQINTNSLTPGNAYTLWLVVVNKPEECNTSPCTAPDIIGNPATESQVRYAAGHVAGGSGQGTFAGSVKEGPLSGWLPDRSLDDAMTAEVHLVINDHGPKLDEFMPGMIRTYRGGCSDASPFPPIFPDAALADGEVGPNICRLFQSAVFLTP
jgi:hypothetical protein